jgi:uncharacterized protein (TIGR02217 family)
MTRFVDVYVDPCVPGYPVLSSPRWSTSITVVDSGAERVNQRWEHPLHRYSLPEAVRSHEIFEAIHDHWMVMRGPVHTFPFRDPLDFASIALTQPNTAPAITGLDQLCGTGDGFSLEFQLQKTYNRGGQTYTRIINRPIVSTVVATVAGVDPLTLDPPMTYSVDRLTGIITTSYAPSPGQIVRAGFLFDIEVRFEADDSFDGVVRTFGLGGFADLTFVEVRPCD